MEIPRKKFRNKLLNQKDTKYFRRSLRKEMTTAERLVWIMLRNKDNGYKFRRQHGIGKFIADFYCPQLKLVVEIDGDIHQNKDVQRQDRQKEQYLKKLHFNVKRYQNEKIFANPNFIYNDLKEYCDKLASLKPSL